MDDTKPRLVVVVRSGQEEEAAPRRLSGMGSVELERISWKIRTEHTVPNQNAGFVTIGNQICHKRSGEILARMLTFESAKRCWVNRLRDPHVAPELGTVVGEVMSRWQNMHPGPPIVLIIVVGMGNLETVRELITHFLSAEHASQARTLLWAQAYVMDTKRQTLALVTP